jgi:hypothetical protein
MIKTIFFIVSILGLACSANGLKPAEVPHVLSERIPRILEEMHKRRWGTIEPAQAERIVGTTLVRREDKYPAGSSYDTPCSGSLYMIAEAADLTLTMEFDHEPNGETCETRLNSIAVEARLARPGTERLLAGILAALRPGGKGGPDPDALQYLWRSADSRTRFDLFVSIIGADNTDGQVTTLKLVLTHDDVQPTEVDDLPYEKGFICRAAPQ